MGWNFRRSINVGPFRMNFSKSGIGYSAGIRGARIGRDTMGRRIGIQGDLDRCPLLPHGFPQKGFRRVHVAVPAQKEVHSFSDLIDRSIQIHPLTSYTDVGFVHAPRSANRTGVPFPAFLEFGRVMLDPPQNCGVRHCDTALAHHGHQIAIAQLKAQIPADA